MLAVILSYLTNVAVTKPVAIGIGIAALIVLYLAFKVTWFILKVMLALAGLAAIGLAACWFYNAH